MIMEASIDRARSQFVAHFENCVELFGLDVVFDWLSPYFSLSFDFSAPPDFDPISEVIESSHESIEEFEDDLPF